MPKKAMRENYLRMKLMEAQLNSEMEKKSIIESGLQEMHQTLECLNELKGIKSADAFFTLGSGIFIEASVKDAGKVFVNIGSGILSPKGIEDAIETVNERIGNANSSLREIDNRILYISEEIRRIEERMNLLSTHAGAD